MNRLRSHKFKPNADAIDCSVTNTNNSNNGLLNKITKRYSTLSNKITRRHPSGRKSASPQKVASGSYDMTGANSEDHRLEIGAPVLISTTTLDTDRFDVTEARLKQIGGGIAGNSNFVRNLSTPQSSPQIPSSGSENEVFVDALCTTPLTVEQYEEREDSYELAFQTPNKSTNFEHEIKIQPKALKTSSPLSECNVASANPMSNYYETAKALRKKSKLDKMQHSKSAQNLHRSELKVFLQKAPSVELNINLTSTTADLEHCHDLPNLPDLPELYGASKCSLAPTDNEDSDANKENSAPSVLMKLQSKSEPNTPLCPELKVTGYLSQQQQFKSVDSLDIHRNGGKRRSVVFSSSNSINNHGSKNSLASHNSTIEDFDLKSVSCQSLNAQNLFVSIDEINEITRQINESEDFSRDIDLEYCMHRDNLKPSERRITLLKNKNSRLISFNNNKEKIKKSWSGVKHWIGEESSKLKEVVQKQATMQRLGASKLNLSNSECRSSPSVNGSVVLRNNSRGESCEKTSRLCDTASSLNLQQSGVSGSSTNELDVSCENIAEEVEENEEDDDLESSVTQRPGDDTSPVTKHAKREGQNGFEELRRYIKQGGDFGKELILILQERVESELLYSKSLTKMANKLNKACRELPGSIAEAWRGVATEMESRSDIHRQLSVSLTDEIVKPLKNIVEGHHKTRKSVECNVDKASRVLVEWRVSEAKAKKASHTAARENEKLQDAILDVRIQKSPSIALLHQGGTNKVAAEKEIKSAEKDCAKLDNKRKKAEEAVKRADVEYYTLCVRSERARVDWEMAVLRGSLMLQNIENQRLVNMKNFASNYTLLTANMNPIVDNLVQRLQPQVDACNVLKDMQVVKNIRRNSEGPSEQLLPDFYCEHTTLAMNLDRRKRAIIKLLQLVKTDLERERRSRNGLKGLSQSLSIQEHQNITDKLYHIRSMLTYLEGTRFKLHSALLELENMPRSVHPLAPHIQITRDRTGLQQSILKVPLWLKINDNMNTSNSSSGGDNTSMRDNEYECVSPQANTSTNISCTDISKDHLIKSFNRSKSNIETFSTNTQICHTNNVTETKTKTIPANLDDAFCDRGQADGGSNQQDSDFDEFSSQDEDDEPPCSGHKEHKAIVEKSSLLANGKPTSSLLNGSVVDGTDSHHYQNSAEINENQQHDSSTNSSTCTTVVLSRCKALYSYTPKLYDELELTPGDIIEVHAKQEDGWWLGALGNQIGIFPATYVEEFA